MRFSLKRLIQCTVVLPKKLAFKDKKKRKKQQAEEEVVEIDGSGEVQEDIGDRDVLINDKYQAATATAYQFLTVFLKKCGSKNEDIDYRPLFENFVQVCPWRPL